MIAVTTSPSDAGDLAGAPSSDSSVSMMTESPMRSSVWITVPSGEVKPFADLLGAERGTVELDRTGGAAND